MESLSGIAHIIRQAVASASADKFSEAGMVLVKARDQIREQSWRRGSAWPLISSFSWKRKSGWVDLTKPSKT